MTADGHQRGRRDRDQMVDGFTTTCAFSAYRHLSCEFKSCSWRGLLDTALCDKVCQVGDFLRVLQFHLPIKLTQRYD